MAGRCLGSEALVLLRGEGPGDGAELGAHAVVLELLEVGEQRQERRLVGGNCSAVGFYEKRPGRHVEPAVPGPETDPAASEVRKELRAGHRRNTSTSSVSRTSGRDTS